MFRLVPATLLLSLTTSLAGPLGALTPTPQPPGGKVFVFSCAVMFATTSRGSSATRPNQPQRTISEGVRSELTKEFNLAGFDSTAFQRMTDQICAGAPAELTAAGYEVITEGVADHYAYRRALGSGQESPQRQGNEGTSYIVYAPTGQKIMDAFVVGLSKSVGIEQGEYTMGVKLGARPVALLYTVDFASLEGDRGTVKADVALTVGLTAVTYDPSQSRCGKLSPFGEWKSYEFCLPKKAEPRLKGTYALEDDQERRSTDPIVSVEEYKDAGTRLVTAVSVLSIVADRGRSSGVATYKKFSVTVDPAKYEAAILEGSKGLVAPAMKGASDPESRPKKGKR